MLNLKLHVERNCSNQSLVIQSQVLRNRREQEAKNKRTSKQQRSSLKRHQAQHQHQHQHQHQQQQQGQNKQTLLNCSSLGQEFKGGALATRSQRLARSESCHQKGDSVSSSLVEALTGVSSWNNKMKQQWKVFSGKSRRVEVEAMLNKGEQVKSVLSTMGALVSLCLICLTTSTILVSAQTQPNEPNSTSSTTKLTLPVESSTRSVSGDVELNADLSVDTREPFASSANSSTQHKLKPINFTLVDEIFEAVLSEEEVVKKWRFMDSQLQDGMKSILKMIFPQIVSISQDAKVSGDCSGGILKWILSLRNLRSWAIKMLDATGKPTSGIFQGSLTMFGNYRQCLSIRAPDEDEIEITDQFEEYFRGQFCVIHLKPWMPVKKPFYHLNSSIDSLVRKNYKYYEKTLYDELAEIAVAFNFIDIRMDLCVPSTCTVADIQRVADLLSKKLEMRSKVLRCDIASRETNLFNHFDRLIYIWLLTPLSLVSLSLISTLFTALKIEFKRTRERSLANSNTQTNQFRTKNQYRNSENKFITLLYCLSMREALRDRLRKPSKSSTLGLNVEEDGAELGSDDQSRSGQQVLSSLTQKPLPLYGLRNLFIFWFIIVQMTMELKYQYLRESLTLRNMIISYWPFQIIVNSTLLFESIIVITAFTYSYTCLESSLKELICYIFNKYIRLIFSIITLIALTIVTPLLAIESPVWRNFVEDQSTICKSTGHINLFFLQNFIPYDKICLPHTWLFCVELQLIVLSIPLILLFKSTFLSTEDWFIIKRAREEGKNGKKQNNSCESLVRFTLKRFICSKAGLMSFAFVTLGALINFFVVYTNQLPPSWFYTFPDVAQKNYYFGLYLTKTWTHLSVFIVGLVSGHLCRSAIQLRYLSLSQAKTNNESQNQQQNHQTYPQQGSPDPSSSTNQSQSQLGSSSQAQSHGSSSTIMAMELSSQVTEDGSTSDDRSNEPKRNSRRCEQMMSSSVQVGALVAMLAITFSTFTWSTKEAPSTLVAALYDSISRLVWSLALVGIMTQLCLPNQHSNRYSGLAKLFSHPILTLLGRLSFLAYLISPYIHTFVLAVEEQSMFPSLFLVFHLIVGNIVITYILAFILAIVIEQPARRLISRFVFGNRICKQKFNISAYYEDKTGSVPTISLPTKPEK